MQPNATSYSVLCWNGLPNLNLGTTSASAFRAPLVLVRRNAAELPVLNLLHRAQPVAPVLADLLRLRKRDGLAPAPLRVTPLRYPARTTDLKSPREGAAVTKTLSHTSIRHWSTLTQ